METEQQVGSEPGLVDVFAFAAAAMSFGAAGIHFSTAPSRSVERVGRGGQSKSRATAV